jgi:hypothetical protein
MDGRKICKQCNDNIRMIPPFVYQNISTYGSLRVFIVILCGYS